MKMSYFDFQTVTLKLTTFFKCLIYFAGYSGVYIDIVVPCAVRANIAQETGMLGS